MSKRIPRDTVTSHDCGWSSKRTTAGLAEYALRRHSCDLQDRRNASAARGAARKAAVDRTPKPCLHPIARHQHGTHACYVLDLCKCPSCSKATADYEKQRVRAHAYGRWHNYVDAEPTRRHVAMLNAAGVGLKQVAKLSGVSHGALWKLMYGKTRPDGSRVPSRRITYDTAIRIQTVHPTAEALAGGAYVEATGTQRRLQALVAIGWSQSKLAEALGMHISNFGTMLNRQQVSARTARAVAALYEQRWDTPPAETNQRNRISASRARNYAKAHGWARPLAWDEDTIDDPAAIPNSHGFDPARVAAVLDGALLDGDEDLELALTRNDRLAVHRHCYDVWRIPTAEAARRTGIPAHLFYADLKAGPSTPTGDVDEVAVQRLISGTLRVAKFSRAPELAEAIRRLAAAGFTDADIGDRVGMSGTNVCNTRIRNGIPAAQSSGRTA